MKRYGHIYEKICDKDNIRYAILKASKGKRKRNDVQRVLSDIDKYIDIIHEMLVTKTYVPSDYIVGTVKEGASQKERKIFKPNFFPDQVIHWAMMLQVSPILRKGMYKFACGSIPDRGVHYGKRYVERWIRTDRKHTKYYLKLDISKFYPSVNVDLLIGKLKRKIKDADAIHLIESILCKGDGLPIGILVSQWFANFYLQDLDYFIKQKLKTKYYVRYMDDMILFGNNKRDLHLCRKRIESFLGSEELKLKPNWQVYRLDCEALDFMGFRFFRRKTILRKSIMHRITRRVRNVSKKSKPTNRDASGVISYLGWIKHSDSYALFCKWIRPYLNIRLLKSVIRNHSRREMIKFEQTQKRICYVS